MALPRKIKDLMLFNEGASYLGQVPGVTLPKLGRKFEEWRAGGMDAAVKVDLGGDYGDFEWTAGGPLRDVLGQHGEPLIDGVLLRFVGVYEADDSGDLVPIEIVIRGRHEEIDQGEQKVGEGGEFKVKTAWTYYRLDWNGVPVIEIDKLGMVLTVDGVDRFAQRRALLGV